MSADPQRMATAVKKIANVTPGAGGTEFAGQLAAFLPSPSPSGRPQSFAIGGYIGRSGLVASTRAASAAATGPAKVARDFETFMLQNQIEAMMPSGKTVSGTGIAGSVWKSMLSRELAQALSKAGGIGLAHHVEASLYARTHQTDLASVSASGAAGQGTAGVL